MLASADNTMLVADRFNVIVLTSCQILRIFGSSVYNIALSTGRQMQLGILRKKFICARSRCRLIVLFRGESSSICVMSHCIRCWLGKSTYSVLDQLRRRLRQHGVSWFNGAGDGYFWESLSADENGQVELKSYIHPGETRRALLFGLGVMYCCKQSMCRFKRQCFCMLMRCS